MNDSTAIQLRNDDRTRIAAAMLEYERRHGPVVTQPIRFDGKIRAGFTIANPDKPKSESRAARQHRQLAEKRDNMNAVRKRKLGGRIEKIREMCARGMTISEMASALGLNPGTVHRHINANGIERGPQTNLEA